MQLWLWMSFLKYNFADCIFKPQMDQQDSKWYCLWGKWISMFDFITNWKSEQYIYLYLVHI